MLHAVVDGPGPWRFDDLADADLPDWCRAEVVDGALVVTPPPSQVHDHVVYHLSRQLGREVLAGWEVRVPLSVALGTDGRVADVGLLRAGLAPKLGRGGHDPDDIALVVEVVSPSSRKTDRLFKPIEYAAAGIPAYWRVETDPHVELYVYELAGEAYAEVARSTGVVDVAAPFLFTIDVPALVPAVAEG